LFLLVIEVFHRGIKFASRIHSANFKHLRYTFKACQNANHIFILESWERKESRYHYGILDHLDFCSDPENISSESVKMFLIYIWIAEKIQDRQAPFQSPGFSVKGHQPGFFVKIAFAEIANPKYVPNNMIAFMTRAGIKLVAASQANALPNPSVLPASKTYHAHFSLLLYAFKIIAMVTMA